MTKDSIRTPTGSPISSKSESVKSLAKTTKDTAGDTQTPAITLAKRQKPQKRILTSQESGRRASHELEVIESVNNSASKGKRLKLARAADLDSKGAKLSISLNAEDIKDVVFTGHFGQSIIARHFHKVSPKALCAIFLSALHSNNSNEAKQIKKALALTQVDTKDSLSLTGEEKQTLANLYKSTLLNKEEQEDIQNTIKAIGKLSFTDKALAGTSATTAVASGVAIAAAIALGGAPAIAISSILITVASFVSGAVFLTKHFTSRKTAENILNKNIPELTKHTTKNNALDLQQSEPNITRNISTDSIDPVDCIESGSKNVERISHHSKKVLKKLPRLQGVSGFRQSTIHNRFAPPKPAQRSAFHKKRKARNRTGERVLFTR